MVGDLAGFPPDAGRLAVEDDVVSREPRDGLHDGRVSRVLGQPVARQQPNVLRLLEREQADAIELALEDPFRAGEALLRERRGHRLYPFRERVGHRPRQDASTTPWLCETMGARGAADTAASSASWRGCAAPSHALQRFAARTRE